MKASNKRNSDQKEKSDKKTEANLNATSLLTLNPDPEYVKGLIRGGYNHAKA